MKGDSKQTTQLVIFKAACCGVLLLAGAGALSGLSTWLAGNGLIWISLAIIIFVTGVGVWRRRSKENSGDRKDAFTGRYNDRDSTR